MSKNTDQNENRVRIEEIMSKGLVTLSADSTAFDAAKEMSTKVISSIIMNDSGKTVGIVTERDLVKQVCAKDLLSSKTCFESIARKCDLRLSGSLKGIIYHIITELASIKIVVKCVVKQVILGDCAHLLLFLGESMIIINMRLKHHYKIFLHHCQFAGYRMFN
jgi:CBS-domain-containing membrane protein